VRYHLIVLQVPHLDADSTEETAFVDEEFDSGEIPGNIAGAFLGALDQLKEGGQ
jgi:hypothetical protein